MKICVYLEHGNSAQWSGGIRRAHENQVKALKRAGIEITTDPSEAFDVLHLHSIGPRSLYLAERFSGRRPLLINSHITAEDFANSFRMSDHIAPYLGRYLRYFYSKADVLIAPSPYARDVLRGYDLLQPIEVVSNGVDVTRFAPDRRRRLLGRARYGLRGVIPFAVGLALLRKGVDLFIETGRLLPVLTFMWFGRVHKAAKVETLRAIEQAPDNVHFPGYVEDVLEAHAAGDIFFFPSAVENEGIAILEAAACGKPLVLRDSECFTGRFEHGSNCLKGETPAEFASHLRRLAEDPDEYTRLADGARLYAESHSLEQVGNRLRAIYAQLTN
ncbi:MAG: glycosyltransferase family 4 protein [Bacillati bacterium ANGP1]|uniref:Glycosyltransferase family 4 protein n=2 Tax=Candidatus Segetimicrobium genomatis TaxID=2569760 RepID=A0A537LIV2_9BACT|nr:MAG: glycosyltransferase family 4 protein [Terrabacteria group bacterium ANGP1]TMJ12176.1 MAG: glycosyltransferase family 4 protein [Terrabacteria group bacterium ANGP1]